VSIATLVAAAVLGGVLLPLALGLVAIVLPAARAGVVAEVARLTLLVALPLALSAVLVNVLFTPAGASILAELGPLRITDTGVTTAVDVVVRVLVMGGAVTLFYVTTRPGELVASLEAHGAPARIAFVIHNAVAMTPRLVERAGDVGAAQRARGLDTEGSVIRRLRGVLAVAGPTVGGAIEEAEIRTLALESRAFSRPGEHTRLWAPVDSAAQRAARWSIGGAVALLLIARLAGPGGQG
jgi:energy-coupling factor transport system permease protein